MNDLNFCMVNPFFYPYTGGSEKHMYELGRRLSKHYNLHVLTSRLKGFEKEETIQNMHVHRVKAHTYKMPPIYPPPLVFARSARKRLRQLDKEHDFDIINLHGRWYADFDYAAKYAKKRGKYCSLTLHNKRPRGISPGVTFLGTWFDALLGRRVLKKVNSIISVSHAAKKDILNYHLDEKKIHVIHNGVDTNVFKPSKPTYKEKYADGFDNFIVFEGRIIKQKGLQYLFNAMPQILEQHPSTRLLVVGKGKMLPKLKRQAKRLHLENNIVFPGFIPEQDLPNMFSSADVFVMPSLWEVLPISLLEALGCGVPLVASDAGGNPEIVKHGKNGYIFPTRNNEQMVKHINTLLDDKNMRTKMGKESRKIALNEFDWDIITKKTINFYEKELNAR